MELIHVTKFCQNVLAGSLEEGRLFVLKKIQNGSEKINKLPERNHKISHSQTVKKVDQNSVWTQVTPSMFSVTSVSVNAKSPAKPIYVKPIRTIDKKTYFLHSDSPIIKKQKLFDHQTDKIEKDSIIEVSLKNKCDETVQPKVILSTEESQITKTVETKCRRSSRTPKPSLKMLNQQEKNRKNTRAVIAPDGEIIAIKEEPIQSIELESDTLNELLDLDQTSECMECGYVSKSSRDHTKHMITHYRDENVCEYCLVKFESLELLKNHIVSHNGKSPFTCKMCLKSFKTR